MMAQWTRHRDTRDTKKDERRRRRKNPWAMPWAEEAEAEGGDAGERHLAPRPRHARKPEIIGLPMPLGVLLALGIIGAVLASYKLYKRTVFAKGIYIVVVQIYAWGGHWGRSKKKLKYLEPAQKTKGKRRPQKCQSQKSKAKICKKMKHETQRTWRRRALPPRDMRPSVFS